MSDFYNKYPYTDFHELNLDWVIERVKKLTEDWAATLEEWNSTEEQWQELYDYVHDYFDNLNVQTEINNKINAMITDGTFQQIANPIIQSKVSQDLPGVVSNQINDVVADQIDEVVADQIDAVVADQIGESAAAATTTWLSEHVDPVGSAVIVDDSLTIAGAAADAKITGDYISIIKSDLNSLLLNGNMSPFNFWESGYLDIDGSEASNSYRYRTPDILTADHDFEIKMDTGYYGYVYFYDTDDSLLFRSSIMQEYPIPKGSKFRCWIASNDDLTDDADEHVNFSDFNTSAYIRSLYDVDEMPIEFISILRNGYLTTSGTFSPVIYRAATFNMIHIEETVIFNIKNGFSADFTSFTSAGVFISRTNYKTGSVMIKPGYYKISIAAVPEDTTVVADLVLFSRALSFTKTNIDYDVINADSFYNEVKYPTAFVRYNIFEKISAITQANNCTIKNSLLNFQHDSYSYEITNDGINSPVEMRFRMTASIEFMGISEFYMALYIPNASNISQMRFGTLTHAWNKYIYGPFSNGWNLIRLNTNGDGMGAGHNITDMRLFIYYNDSTITTPVYLAHLEAIKPPHASFVFVDDGPYGSFYDYAYPRLSAINCPITWAIECDKIKATRQGSRPLISLDELATIEMDGTSEISWHGYDGELTNTMNAEDTAKYNLKCIRFLSRRGDFTGKIFRAVWPGNDAPNINLAIQDLDACATNDGSNGFELYPYRDIYNIPRNSLQTRDTTWIDNLFDVLEKTHQVTYVYTHGIIDSSDYDPANQDMRLDMLEYMISKISSGMTAGWLHPTTFNRLDREYHI